MAQSSNREPENAQLNPAVEHQLIKNEKLQKQGLFKSRRVIWIFCALIVLGCTIGGIAFYLYYFLTPRYPGICEHGQPVTNSYDTDDVISCVPGSCHPGYHGQVVNADSLNINCVENVCTCKNGSPMTGKDCPEEQEKCLTCDTGYNINLTNDKCESSCEHGKQDESGVCKKCKLGYYMTEKENTCKPWVECPSEACPVGTPKSGKACNNEKDADYSVKMNCEIKGCQEKYHEELNYLLCKDTRSRSIKVIQKLKVDKGEMCNSFGRSWTETEIKMCRENICKCDNGNVSTEKDCVAHGSSLCDDDGCNAGYRPFSDECIENICTCENGTPNSIDNHSVDQCKQDRDESCFSCNPGYTLNINAESGLSQCVKAKPDEKPSYFHTGAPLPTKKLKECQDRGECQDGGALYCDHIDDKKLIKAVKPDNTIDLNCKPVTCKCFVGEPQTGPGQCKYPKFNSSEVMIEKCDREKCDPDYYDFSTFVDFSGSEHEICEHTAGNKKWAVSRRVLDLNQEDLKTGKRTYRFRQTKPNEVCGNWTDWDEYSEEKFSHFDLRENYCRNPDGASQSEKYLWCLKKGTQFKVECYSLATEISDVITKEKEEYEYAEDTDDETSDDYDDYDDYY